MPLGDPVLSLFGRDQEGRVLEATVNTARSEMGGSLVIRGQAGIGKTALLDRVAAAASDFEVIRVAGVPAEMAFGYAALHRVLAPYLGGLGELPVGQRQALETVFGLGGAGAPDRFLVGLATLSLMSDTAHRRALLCILDDAQWLDHDSLAVFVFVARRLLADRIALLFAVREPAEVLSLFEGLPDLEVTGLDQVSSQALLSAATEGVVAHRVAEQISVLTGGNPLALEEVARELSREQLSGAIALPESLPMGPRLESSFLGQVRSLPPDTQTVLLLAASDPAGDPGELRRAADCLDVPLEATIPAERVGLLQIRSRVGFRHPLIRSAIYGGATDADRRRAHGAWAAVIDPLQHADRRASHLASAAVGPDDSVADELERSAARAGKRGGFAAEAVILSKAAAFTVNPRDRGARLLSAVQAAQAAGDPRRAHTLLEEAAAVIDDPAQRASAQSLEASLRYVLGDNRSAPAALLEAARALAPVDSGRSRGVILEAMSAILVAGDYAEGVSESDIANAGLEALRKGTEGTTSDLLLRALALLSTQGHEKALPAFREAAAHLLAVEVSRDELTLWSALETAMANQLWDDVLFRQLLERLDRAARQQGALYALNVVLSSFAAYHTRAGRFDIAESCHLECNEVGLALFGPVFDASFLNVELQAWRGNDEATRSRVRTLEVVADHLGAASLIHMARVAVSILELGQGHYPEAYMAVRPVVAAVHPFYAPQALPNLVEAAVRCGRIEEARSAAEELARQARSTGTPWALGQSGRANALLADDDAADKAFTAALEWLGATAWRTEVARTQLLYGEWLRRQKRRLEARVQLRAGYEAFAVMGANAFAERARIELLATGERARSRSVESAQQLTAREAQIAVLASQRVTSREIGAQLFISANTVEYHLRKVFTKLGVSSRRELPGKLAAVGTHTEANGS